MTYEATETETPMGPFGPPTYEVVDITPELAAEWLERNTHNRKLRPRAVDAYADDMANGRWRGENGESVKLTWDGRILDGQHRLHAIKKSGEKVRMLVVSNLPMHAQETVDTGAKRSFSDVLALRGEKNCSVLAAVTRRVLFWEKGLRVDSGNFQPTHAQLSDVIDRHPELRDTAPIANKVRQAIPIPASVAGLCHWLFTSLDEEDTKFFFERLMDGANLAADHPINVLRRTVIEGQTSRSRLTEQTMTAFLIKAWNAYRDGRSIGLLRFRPGGANPESFPEPK